MSKKAMMTADWVILTEVALALSVLTVTHIATIVVFLHKVIEWTKQWLDKKTRH